MAHSFLTTDTQVYFINDLNWAFKHCKQGCNL